MFKISITNVTSSKDNTKIRTDDNLLPRLACRAASPMPLRTGAALGFAPMPYPNEQRSKPVVSPSIVHQTDWLQYYTKDSQNGLQSKKKG